MTLKPFGSLIVVTPSRTGKYAEAYNLPMGIGRYGLADEGSYYTVASVIGTDITAKAPPDARARPDGGF